MQSTETALAMSTLDPKSLKHTYHRLRVSQVIRETEDACSVVFEIPEPLREVFAYQAGQFLTLEVPYDGVVLKRCYSLASSPDVDTEHKVTIKRVEGGRISNWINDALKPGDTLLVLPPDGRFVMSHEAEHMVLFAGGSGITPIISLAKSALAKTQRKVTIVYANRNAQSVIFAAELAALAKAHPGRFCLIPRLDNVDGFLRIGDIGRLVGPSSDAEYFLCGPQGFMDTVERGLTAIGVPEGRVHIERFVSPADPRPEGKDVDLPAGAELPELVRVELSGKSYDVPYAAGKSLLKAVLDAGLDAPYSCEEGFCGSCVARLVEGSAHMTEDDALTADEKKKGYVLTCQAHPTSRSCSIKYLDF